MRIRTAMLKSRGCVKGIEKEALGSFTISKFASSFMCNIFLRADPNRPFTGSNTNGSLCTMTGLQGFSLSLRTREDFLS